MIPAKSLDRTIYNIKYRLEKYYVRMGLTHSPPQVRVCKDFSNPSPLLMESPCECGIEPPGSISHGVCDNCMLGKKIQRYGR